MSKHFKMILVAVVLGLVLMIASLIVPDSTSTGNRLATVDAMNLQSCGNPALNDSEPDNTVTARGYPFSYLRRTGASEGGVVTSNICMGANAASATDTIAQHTPGHQRVFSLINDHTIDVLPGFQDLVIMTLIALYPASIIVNRYNFNWRRKK